MHAAPVLPDGCLDIVFSQPDGLRAVGAMTTVQRFDHLDGSKLCGVRFLPGMARNFLGIPAGELTDGAASLQDLIGSAARALEERLRGVGSAAEGARLLAASLPTPGASPNPVQRSIRALATAHGIADLDRVCGDANLSPRQFRRRCLEESGLTPKHLCRVLRFRRALCLAANRPRDWANLAVAAGYFDQSHLIRDFQEFAGHSPMAVFSNPAPPPLA